MIIVRSILAESKDGTKRKEKKGSEQCFAKGGSFYCFVLCIPSKCLTPTVFKKVTLHVNYIKKFTLVKS